MVELFSHLLTHLALQMVILSLDEFKKLVDHRGSNVKCRL